GRGTREVVCRRARRGARLKMVTGPADRPGDARRRVDAKSRHALVALEPDGLSVERGLEAAVHRPEPRERNLRQARVRAVKRVDAEVDGLEVLHLAVEPPACAEPREVDEPVEEGDARAVGPEAEILEVAAVARVRQGGVD